MTHHPTADEAREAAERALETLNSYSSQYRHCMSSFEVNGQPIATDHDKLTDIVWNYLTSSSDLVKRLTDERDAALKATLFERSQDTKDEHDDAIRQAHPVVTKDFSSYTKALEMVSNRHSKGALVNLVNWLVSDRARLTEQLAEARRLMEPFGEIGYKFEPDEGDGEHQAFMYCDLRIKHFRAVSAFLGVK